ncbi:MAG: radical SAM protein [Candidatus Falkowbacteria bacterium]
MILEIKRYGDYAQKSLFRKDKLNFLILYVTSKCNLSCQTCFFHKNLNKSDDLNLSEYEKIAQSAGEFSILGLGGGEPFLNSDLEKICTVFIDKCKINTLFIPTNGALTEIILDKTEYLLKKFPNISISINPSLDGMAAYHDKNRGQPGIFNQCIFIIEKLTALKKKYKNLQVIVNSVISRENIEELKKLMEYLKQFEIDFQAFEIMRGDWRSEALNLPSLNEIKEIHKLIIKNRFWHLNKKKSKLANKLLFKLEEIAVLGVLRYSQIFKELAIAGQSWPTACSAGKSIAVIYPDGNFSVCELLPPLANLKQFNYNFQKILKNKNTRDFVKNIKQKSCGCTHICFIHSSLARDPKSIFKIYSNYLKARNIIKYD